MFESRRTHDVISHLIKILVTWLKKKKGLITHDQIRILWMFFISYFEMMLKWCWHDVEMSQDYFLHVIFQDQKSSLNLFYMLHVSNVEVSRSSQKSMSAQIRLKIFRISHVLIASQNDYIRGGWGFPKMILSSCSDDVR